MIVIKPIALYINKSKILSKSFILDLTVFKILRKENENYESDNELNLKQCMMIF